MRVCLGMPRNRSINDASASQSVASPSLIFSRAASIMSDHRGDLWSPYTSADRCEQVIMGLGKHPHTQQRVNNAAEHALAEVSNMGVYGSVCEATMNTDHSDRHDNIQKLSWSKVAEDKRK